MLSHDFQIFPYLILLFSLLFVLRTTFLVYFKVYNIALSIGFRLYAVVWILSVPWKLMCWRLGPQMMVLLGGGSWLEKKTSLRLCTWRVYCDPGPILSLHLSSATMIWAALCYHKLPDLMFSLAHTQSYGTKWAWAETMSQNTTFILLSLFIAGNLSQWWESC
jgi:hypothetical protein